MKRFKAYSSLLPRVKKGFSNVICLTGYEKASPLLVSKCKTNHNEGGLWFQEKVMTFTFKTKRVLPSRKCSATYNDDEKLEQFECEMMLHQQLCPTWLLFIECLQKHWEFNMNSVDEVRTKQEDYFSWRTSEFRRWHFASIPDMWMRFWEMKGGIS